MFLSLQGSLHIIAHIHRHSSLAYPLSLFQFLPLFFLYLGYFVLQCRPLHTPQKNLNSFFSQCPLKKKRKLQSGKKEVSVVHFRACLIDLLLSCLGGWPYAFISFSFWWGMAGVIYRKRYFVHIV